MNITIQPYTLLACLALSLGSQLQLQAQDTPATRGTGDGPRRGGGLGFFMRGPAFEALSQEEKDKLKAANEKASQDSKVKAAREKMEAAAKELRETTNAALVAADPSVEPILAKLQAAAQARRGADGERRNRTGTPPAASGEKPADPAPKP